MTLSLVAVVADVMRDGKRVVGDGFNSHGRDRFESTADVYAQMRALAE